MSAIHNIGWLDGDIEGTVALLNDVAVDLHLIASGDTAVHRAMTNIDTSSTTAWEYLLPDCMHVGAPGITDCDRANFIGMTIAIDYRHWTTTDFDPDNVTELNANLEYKPLQCLQFWYLSQRTHVWHRGSMAMTMALRDAVDVHNWHWYRPAVIDSTDPIAYQAKLREALRFVVQPYGAERPDTSEVEVSSWQRASIPAAAQRAGILREIAQSLLRREASFRTLALSASGRLFDEGRGFVEQVVGLSPRFEDFAVIGGHKIALIKLASLTAVALVSARRKFDEPSVFEFLDTRDMAVCPDYQLPKTLRSAHIVRYSDRLAALVDSGAALPRGSREEHEIRLATTVAARALMNSMPSATLESLDFCLWLLGRTSTDRHHLTVTSMY